MITGYFYTFLWSLTPFLELRAAIPLGYLKYDIPLYEAVAISVVGVIFSVLVLLVLLPILVGFFDRHIPFFHRILQAIFARTRAKLYAGVGVSIRPPTSLCFLNIRYVSQTKEKD